MALNVHFRIIFLRKQISEDFLRYYYKVSQPKFSSDGQNLLQLFIEFKKGLVFCDCYV